MIYRIYKYVFPNLCFVHDFVFMMCSSCYVFLLMSYNLCKCRYLVQNCLKYKLKYYIHYFITCSPFRVRQCLPRCLLCKLDCYKFGTPVLSLFFTRERGEEAAVKCNILFIILIFDAYDIFTCL